VLVEIPPSVRLLDPGAAPRQTLRYQLRPGAAEYVELDMKMTIAMAMKDTMMGAMSRTTEMPTIRTALRLAVVDLASDGEARIVFDLDNVDVLSDVAIEPAVRTALETELAGMVGMRGSSRMSTRGAQSEIVFELPNASPSMKNHLDGMRDSIRHMYVLFPEEPVGPGARWETTSRFPTTGGMLWDRKASCTLVRLTGTTTEIDVQLELSAPRQAMQLPPGSTGVLESLDGKGGGKVSIPLRQLATTGNMKLATDAAFTVTTKASSVSMTMKVTADLSTRQGKPARRPVSPRDPAR